MNDKIIGNISILKNISKEELQITDYSKETTLNSIKLFSPEWKKQEMENPNLRIGWIVKVTTEFKFKLKTQAALNTFFGLKESNNIFINEYLLNKEYSIINEYYKLL